MSRRLKVAMMLQPGADGTAAGTREQARYAEQLGLDGIFVGDHLKPAGPYPESMVVLAAAAAVTERIHVGFGVMVLALRDPAWAAKQLATLQHVSGGRVVRGVGTGGVMHGTEAWEAVGVPYAERGRRTDEALALLPGLIRSETVELPSGASITLSPGADVPPILIGGNSPAALRRAVRHGAGWFSSVTTPQRVADGDPPTTRHRPDRRRLHRPARRRHDRPTHRQPRHPGRGGRRRSDHGHTDAGRRAVRGRRRRDMARPHRDRRRLARPMGADRRSRHAVRLTTDGLVALGTAREPPSIELIKGSTTIVELLRMFPGGEAAAPMSRLSLPCAHCGGAFNEPLTMAAKRHKRDARAMLEAFRALQRGGPSDDEVARAAQRVSP